MDIEKIKAALKPFAKLAQVMPPDFGDDDSIGSNFTIGLLAGHLRRAAEAYAALESAQGLIDKPVIEGGGVAIYRHKKTGGLYERLMPMGRVQSSSPLHDMDEVAIYRAQKDGTLRARKASEFDDGRFEALSPALVN